MSGIERTDQRETFSIYNAPGTNVAVNSENPLSFLTGDPEHGWYTARNLLKPLNHLDFLREKEQAAVSLNLHNYLTSPEIFEANYQLLEDHQQGQKSTEDVIKTIASQTNITIETARGMLKEYAKIRHMEFHPSDVCNLTCRGCTYGHDNPETKPLPINFPFFGVEKIAQLEPRSMVIIGGGEPTLYANSGRRFQQLVEEIDRVIPNVALAMVSNGTHRPEGNWPNRFSWIRLSLDAATSGTYSNFRGKETFDQVVDNFLDYLDSKAKYVGISFLYAKPNVHEYAQVADYVFNLVKKERPQHLHKVNIQYRPIRRDPRDYHKPFDLAVIEDQIEQATKDVLDLAGTSPEMEQFLREQTNVIAILGGNSHPPLEFERCYYSQTFHIVRANGDLRPCFIRVVEPDFILGNVLNDSLETIALNTLYVGAKKKTDCDSHGCRQCHVNHIFEKGLKGEMQSSTSPEVLSDPMY